MKICDIIIPASIILAVVFIAHSGEEKSFVYDSSALVDPFIPLITKDGKLLISYSAIKSIDDIVLEGIIYDPNGPSVVIMNDMMLKENDIVGKMRIKKITQYGVVIEYAGKDQYIMLKE